MGFYSTYVQYRPYVKSLNSFIAQEFLSKFEKFEKILEKHVNSCNITDARPVRYGIKQKQNALNPYQI